MIQKACGFIEICSVHLEQQKGIVTVSMLVWKQITTIRINMNSVLHYEEWPTMVSFCHINNFTMLICCFNANLQNL